MLDIVPDTLRMAADDGKRASRRQRCKQHSPGKALGRDQFRCSPPKPHSDKEMDRHEAGLREWN